MKIIKQLLDRRRKRLSDKPCKMQELIDSENHDFPAAFKRQRDSYNKLSEVPNNN
jgi:hypothetical protein